jgi:hypothetical protein
MHLLPKRLKLSFKEWIKQEKEFSCKGGGGGWFRNITWLKEQDNQT